MLTVGLVFGAIWLIDRVPGPSHPSDDIPRVALRAYRQASAQRCPDLPWSVLAGIGRIESRHGTWGGARPDRRGTVTPPIIGIRLDGTRDTARIPDTDGGRLDGDRRFDRAVGPMQFIPSTWRRYAIDANGDGVADPHNLHDAAHTAAAYLCAAGAEDRDGLPGALLAYNRSHPYVDAVLAAAAEYDEPMVAPVER